MQRRYADRVQRLACLVLHLCGESIDAHSNSAEQLVQIVNTSMLNSANHIIEHLVFK